jgi:hypothetical protein
VRARSGLADSSGGQSIAGGEESTTPIDAGGAGDVRAEGRREGWKEGRRGGGEERWSYGVMERWRGGGTLRRGVL